MLLSVFLILAPALSFGMNSLGYDWSIPAYGAANGGYGLGNLLKSGAYGALKGAGAGAAIGGIIGLLG
ncbi:unnamed protein product [Onchocerca ochengi]|uniref:Conjugative transposon protein TraJ n=1 Tax=Onchocerca ochengi TaxID=42157 RepID=A0A182E181_ONCOC|nr:unnamed protein product [Onchocerca ochengi]